MASARRIVLTVILMSLPYPRLAAQETPISARIAAALVPLPASLRAGAGVVVLDEPGQPRALRLATNGVVCIADAPGDAWFDVECYQSSFIPLVYRQRALRAAGISEEEAERRVEAEIQGGTLMLSTRPTMNYQVFGPIAGYDSATNTISSAIRRTERLFIPWSTPGTTAVPEDDDRLHPWLMSAGTWFAHVMIVPRAPVLPLLEQ